MLQATGGTSKGSLGLWWSIWQKLLRKPRRGFSIVHHVCWRFWANMRCYQWEQWISFLVAISQIQPPKWSWMYWSCLSIRSCRSQWWQQCWLGDRLHEIGGTWLWHSYGNLAYQVHLNTCHIWWTWFRWKKCVVWLCLVGLSIQEGKRGWCHATLQLHQSYFFRLKRHMCRVRIAWTWRYHTAEHTKQIF